MSTPEDSQITVLLQAWSNGDPTALDRLTPLVYEELRRLARRYIQRERDANTLQTTALAHEAYLRLVDIQALRWQDRAHFFAVSAQVMRRILVDAARARGAAKRGGAERVDGAMPVDLDQVPDPQHDPSREFLAVDEALNELAALDQRKARVIELRFFGGLSVEETAEVMKVSPQTVMRELPVRLRH